MFRYEVIVCMRQGDHHGIKSLLEENGLAPQEHSWHRMRDATEIFGEGEISEELKIQIEELGSKVRSYEVPDK